MTEVAVNDPPLELIPESFWGVILRRGRYVLAACVSGFLFYWLGWMAAAPPANMAGVSLTAWGVGPGMTAAAALLAILIVATFICTLLVHPDTPHMGLFCALLGMTALSIRGGTVHMLFQDVQVRNIYPQMSRMMALECVQWTVLFLIAEVFARFLHDRFFTNTRWLKRSGVDFSKALRMHGAGGVAGIVAGEGFGIAVSVARRIGTLNLPRMVAAPLALVVNCLLAALFLYGFLQTPEKGQVLFACFMAFLISTHFTYYAFSKVPALIFFLSVPATAAVGYWLSAGYEQKYPGYAGLFFGRALPLDYIAAGVPGAILGYYLALHWNLSSQHIAGEFGAEGSGP